MNRMRPWLARVQQRTQVRTEKGYEASRSDRTRRAQFARICSAEFTDHHRYLGGSGVAGRDAFSGNRAATACITAADEVWIVRYRGGHLTARSAQLQPWRRTQRTCSSRKPDPRRVYPPRDRESAQRARSQSGHPFYYGAELRRQAALDDGGGVASVGPDKRCIRSVAGTFLLV